MIKAAEARTVEAGGPAQLRLFRDSSSLTDVNAFSLTLQDPPGMPERVETNSATMPESLGATGWVISDNRCVDPDEADDRSRFEVSIGGIARVTSEMLGQEVHHVR